MSARNSNRPDRTRHQSNHRVFYKVCYKLDLGLAEKVSSPLVEQHLGPSHEFSWSRMNCHEQQ
uniref:Putative ovule protein n=1 Tax=Solanum chacoense TaxID=4108 RepID=A0A0V0H8D6_SOLCH